MKSKELSANSINEIYLEMASIRSSMQLFFRRLDFIEAILGRVSQIQSPDLLERTLEKIREFLLKKNQTSAREIYKKLHLSSEQVFDALEQMERAGEISIIRNGKGSTIITLRK